MAAGIANLGWLIPAWEGHLCTSLPNSEFCDAKLVIAIPWKVTEAKIRAFFFPFSPENQLLIIIKHYQITID